eukprot:scaffold245_cov341-Pavlova_lutheri.AAC.4
MDSYSPMERKPPPKRLLNLRGNILRTGGVQEKGASLLTPTEETVVVDQHVPFQLLGIEGANVRHHVLDRRGAHVKSRFPFPASPNAFDPHHVGSHPGFVRSFGPDPKLEFGTFSANLAAKVGQDVRLRPIARGSKPLSNQTRTQNRGPFLLVLSAILPLALLPPRRRRHHPRRGLDSTVTSVSTEASDIVHNGPKTRCGPGLPSRPTPDYPGLPPSPQSGRAGVSRRTAPPSFLYASTIEIVQKYRSFFGDRFRILTPRFRSSETPKWYIRMRDPRTLKPHRLNLDLRSPSF